MSLDLLVVDGNVNLESLEEIDDHENTNCSSNVVKIWEIFSQKSMFQSLENTLLIPQSMEESHKGAFIFFTEFHETKTLPKQFFTNIGSNKQADS